MTDPWGNVLSSMEAGTELRITEINLEECSRAREQIPVLRHRREDVYTLKER